MSFESEMDSKQKYCCYSILLLLISQRTIKDANQLGHCNAFVGKERSPCDWLPRPHVIKDDNAESNRWALYSAQQPT